MQVTDYQFVFIPEWEVLSHANYYFTTNKELYNSKTNRIVKQVVKGGYSRGYVLDGKFITLKKLKPMLKKIK
tara:strand:+ start:1894 stop:2109 length:216 start_codon:yes stop_codon:yes gene_type:complete